MHTRFCPSTPLPNPIHMYRPRGHLRGGGVCVFRQTGGGANGPASGQCHGGGTSGSKGALHTFVECSPNSFPSPFIFLAPGCVDTDTARGGARAPPLFLWRLVQKNMASMYPSPATSFWDSFRSAQSYFPPRHCFLENRK